MYIFLNRSFIAKIYVFPIYFLIKISHDTCQSNLRVLCSGVMAPRVDIRHMAWK